MRSLFIILLGLFLLPPAGRAEKKQRTAKVLGSGVGHAVHHLENVPCKMALEGILRDRGFRLLAERDPTKPDLIMSSTAACNALPGVRTMGQEITCNMEIKYSFGRKTYKKKFQGRSRSSVTSAWSDGCQQVRKWVATRMGKPIDRDALPDPHKWKKRKVRASFHWKRGLSPMPLLKITGFFNKAGYQAKMTRSGPTSCHFKLSLDQPPEQLAELLRTYLGTKYKISGGYAKGKLRFTLKAR